VRMAREGHYQIACTRLFEVTRAPALKAARLQQQQQQQQQQASAGEAGDGGSGGGVSDTGLLVTADGLVDTVEHPNQWFDLSYRGERKKRGGAGGAAGENIVQEEEGMDVDR
jgi:DNA primase large subunit